MRLEAGGQGKTEVFAINTEAQAQTYYVRAVPFGTRADQTGPVFGITDVAGVVSWVRVPVSFSVPAHRRTAIPVSVSVPVGTKPGGYYVAILVSNAPGEVVASAGVSPVQANIASLLFLTVGGTGLEKMALLDVAFDGPAVRDALWGTFQYRLQNQGDVHVMPAGTVRVRDFFGREIAEGAVNEEGLRLMPQNTRTFVAALPGTQPRGFGEAVRMQLAHFALGPAVATLTLTPGPTPETPITASFRFWIIPWQLLLFLFGGVAILYAVLKRLARPLARA